MNFSSKLNPTDFGLLRDQVLNTIHNPQAKSLTNDPRTQNNLYNRAVYVVVDKDKSFKTVFADELGSGDFKAPIDIHTLKEGTKAFKNRCITLLDKVGKTDRVLGDVEKFKKQEGFNNALDLLRICEAIKKLTPPKPPKLSQTPNHPHSNKPNFPPPPPPIDAGGAVGGQTEQYYKDEDIFADPRELRSESVKEDPKRVDWIDNELYRRDVDDLPPPPPPSYEYGAVGGQSPENSDGEDEDFEHPDKWVQPNKTETKVDLINNPLYEESVFPPRPPVGFTDDDPDGSDNEDQAAPLVPPKRFFVDVDGNEVPFKENVPIPSQAKSSKQNKKVKSNQDNVYEPVEVPKSAKPNKSRNPFDLFKREDNSFAKKGGKK